MVHFLVHRKKPDSDKEHHMCERGGRELKLEVEG